MTLRTYTRGFTLIELSIVLVIIGLIVGGILVGQDLIRAAGVRAQVSQIEKFNSAANTFYGKYGYLPGDIPAIPAAQFGFAARGTGPGQGDGNGVIVGASSTQAAGSYQFAGETAMFWVDLSTANLIEGGFNTASSTVSPSGAVTPISNPSLNAYLPQGKIGNGNYVYVWSEAACCAGTPTPTQGNANFYGLSAVTLLSVPSSNPALTVNQAYAIDTKTDDGLPQSGRVIAVYLNNLSVIWAGGTAYVGNQIPATYTTATTGSATSCFDNGGNAGTQQTYSVEINNGANIACALSFKLQAGD